jgi:hypothetical protein
MVTAAYGDLHAIAMASRFDGQKPITAFLRLGDRCKPL